MLDLRDNKISDLSDLKSFIESGSKIIFDENNKLTYNFNSEILIKGNPITNPP